MYIGPLISVNILLESSVLAGSLIWETFILSVPSTGCRVESVFVAMCHHECDIGYNEDGHYI